MTSLDSILLEARSLSPSQRAELVSKLLERAAGDVEMDEAAVGQRGLAAWTESTQDETWEPYYPSALRSKRESAS